jgi:hypothetical protein
MAKPTQTFKKRQRENKLREKAQMKRENRQQRAMERKLSKAADQAESALPVPQEVEQAASYNPGGDLNS